MAGISSDPAAVQALCDRGLALAQAGRPDEARAAFAAALARDPAHVASLQLLAWVEGGAGRYDAAADLLSRAVAAAPRDAGARCNLGLALSEAGRREAAIVQFDAALALDPRLPQAHYNRGVALAALDRYEEALASYDAALRLAPDYARAWGNRGVALTHLLQIEAAAEAFARAWALDPADTDAQCAHALRLLQLGRRKEGYRAFWKARQRARPPLAPPLDRLPEWSGGPLPPGRRLLVAREQGLGDTLQFFRYAPVLGERGLLEGSFPQLDFVDDGQAPADAGAFISLDNLPAALGVGDEDPPPPIRLQVEAARREAFAVRLGAASSLRIGLAWSGNPDHENDAARSLPFAAIAPLVDPHAQWHALQNQVHERDRAAFTACGRVAFHGEALGDFADAAALVSLMDLVITCDTSLAHLAGALGKPVWILLPYVPDWRWGLEGASSPWYPTARLYRQPRRGDWAAVVAAVAADLALRS